MIRSGIPPLDERLGGLVPGRVYVLSGAPGTGKSVACLEFIAAAFEQGETAVMITHDDPSDLMAQAQYLGIDLDRALADERLIILRFQLDFVRRYGRAASVDIVFDELRRLIGTATPSRVAIDSVAPFLEGGPASGSGLTALLEFLDSLKATSLITYPGDFSAAYDRRLQPIMQRAAGIFHLTVDPDRTGHLEIRKVRFEVPSTAPVRFRIQPGAGLVTLADHRKRRSHDVDEDTKSKVLVLDVTKTFPEEFLYSLRTQYNVAVRTGVVSAYADLAQSVGAILLDVRRDTVAEVLTLTRELRRGANRAPILLVTQYRLRSDDRARALRAGADDFLSTTLHPEEFLLRVRSAIARGHFDRMTEPEAPLVVQPSNGNGPTALTEAGFRQALAEHMNRDRVPFFTVVSLRTQGESLDELTRLALRNVRVESGDLVGADGDSVAVYLHSARRKDVVPFVERLKQDALRAGQGDLLVETATYPGDDTRLQRFLEQPANAEGADAL
jgi:KaiC/GvpD/RAD55 family RecA-like ATPase/CheY-like chemotaxis protein